MAKDPVCGMEVDEEQAAAKVKYQDQPYYFCSPVCRLAFEKDPEKYVRPKQDEPQ
ncbi:MAG: YHS domain-containing protein [Anaerolineae bacterium]